MLQKIKKTLKIALKILKNLSLKKYPWLQLGNGGGQRGENRAAQAADIHGTQEFPQIQRAIEQGLMHMERKFAPPEGVAMGRQGVGYFRTISLLLQGWGF